MEQRFNYESQTSIDINRVDRATALAIRSGLDPGRVVRTMGGYYTGAWRNVDAVLKNVPPVVTETDYQHIKRILTTRCPPVLKFEEPLVNKLKMMKRDNQKSVMDNPNLAEKIINKEYRYSRTIPLHD